MKNCPKSSASDSRIGDLRAAINFSPVVGESADKADADADKADETAAGKTNSMDRGMCPPGCAPYAEGACPNRSSCATFCPRRGNFWSMTQTQPGPSSGRGWYVCSETACREKFRRFHRRAEA